ncbi:MAG TPA: preprotein translocase subunit SecY [Candidatus Nanoarchaeia archaeon]|nr:preprotein translocase subunit SecY [Candidatus Nanoarchaeia archaeon]
MDFKGIFNFIPEVKKPEEKKLDFNTKLKWTLIVLISFFVLANISLFGLSINALERFEYLAIILGTDFGSIISLGIGPIVMASIILQLLMGSGIISIDTTTIEGKKFFQGIQKILVFFFIIFEALIYVLMQGLQANPGFAWLVILQLILGGLAIYYMAEVSDKWGFGSGVSLFIGAGVAWRVIASAFQFVNQQGRNCLLDFKETACSGKILVLIQSIINKYPIEFLSALAAILSTIIIFLIVVWAQSLKVEIPLSFGRIRGYGVKWPLSFFYASVLPVILVAALIANLQLFGGLIENAAAPCISNLEDISCTGGAKAASYFTFLGHFIEGQPVSGLAFWVGSTNLLELTIRGGFLWKYLIQGITHILFFVVLCSLFSIFWVKTSGMDAKSQAHKISASGLQVAGFRQDERIIESILDRYIMPLTFMGGAAIGLLAAATDLVGALVSGTAMLLVIMITFQFYQNIAQQHVEDMNPAIRKFMGG